MGAQACVEHQCQDPQLKPHSLDDTRMDAASTTLCLDTTGADACDGLCDMLGPVGAVPSGDRSGQALKRAMRTGSDLSPVPQQLAEPGSPVPAWSSQQRGRCSDVDACSL